MSTPPPFHFQLPSPLPSEPFAIAELFASLGRLIASRATTRDALQAVVEVAAAVVPGARWVSVTRDHNRQWITEAATDPVVRAIDTVQYHLRTGPCIDAVIGESVFHSDNLSADGRWDGFGPLVAARYGAMSVLSIRLTMEEQDDLNAGLNIYGERTFAFDDDSRMIATLLAAHAAAALETVVNRVAAAGLARALESNRTIGIAIGVLMTSAKITDVQAFDLLRVASQNGNIKLRDLAADVVHTGVLELPRYRRLI